MLLLTDTDVVSAMQGGDAVRRSIEVIERCFVEIARGDVAHAPRVQVMYPPTAKSQAESELSLHAVLGMVPELGTIGARIFTGRRGGEDLTGTHRHWKLLWDFDSLDLVCVMADESVHPYLVGAHVGVATRYLARPDARVAGVVGSGKMAMGSLRAICAVRDVQEARVFSPNAENRQAFAKTASEELDVAVHAVDRPEQAVRDADIVSVATNTAFRGTGPALDHRWLAPGTHVNSIAPAEIDEATVLAATIVPASTEAVVGAQPRWEPVRSLMEQGAIPAEHLGGDLGDVVVGTRPGRTRADEVTLYVGPSLGPQHAAVGAWILEAARSRGVGREWDPETGEVS